METNLNGWEYLMNLNKVCSFTSREGDGGKGSKTTLVSNSELKRWCQNSVLRINGNVIKWDQSIPDPEDIHSVTLFSKEKRVTIL